MSYVNHPFYKNKPDTLPQHALWFALSSCHPLCVQMLPPPHLQIDLSKSYPSLQRCLKLYLHYHLPSQRQKLCLLIWTSASFLFCPTLALLASSLLFSTPLSTTDCTLLSLVVIIFFSSNAVSLTRVANSHGHSPQMVASLHGSYFPWVLLTPVSNCLSALQGQWLPNRLYSLFLCIFP